VRVDERDRVIVGMGLGVDKVVRVVLSVADGVGVVVSGSPDDGVSEADAVIDIVADIVWDAVVVTVPELVGDNVDVGDPVLAGEAEGV
jgi:hypothetical protein